jgi:hypothetical protein
MAIRAVAKEDETQLRKIAKDILNCSLLLGRPDL